MSFKDRHAGQDTSDKLVTELLNVIPSKVSYYIYETLLPVLKAFEKQSELLSREKVPTIPDVIPALFTIQKKINEVIFGSTVTYCIQLYTFLFN